MKKFLLSIVCIIIFFCGYLVYAKDTTYTLNKYSEEELYFVKDSYDSELEVDGVLVAGSFLKESFEDLENIYNDYQVILIKYRKNGSIAWTFKYGKNIEDKIDYLDYYYDQDGDIQGYLVVMKTTRNIFDEDINNSTILMINLAGELVDEINLDCYLEKVIPVFNDTAFDGYIGINSDINTYIKKYDSNFNLLSSFTYDYECIDTCLFNNTLIVIRKLYNEENIEKTILVQYTLDGNEINSVDLDMNNYHISHIKTINNELLIYGIVYEVKVDEGSSTYFIKKYNSNLEEEWESIGNAYVIDDVTLIDSYDENGLKYFLAYYNQNDLSYEVITLNNEGIELNKVKKIKNDYYKFNNFLVDKKTLYFIGRIKCPIDDNCVYNSKSLFLISDEDKVIEVKDKESKNILVFTIVFIIIFLMYYYRKKKRKLT